MLNIRAMEEKDIPQVEEIEKKIFSLPWSEKSFHDACSDENNIYLVCDITEYDTTAFGDKGIEVYVNDKLIGNIDSKGTTKLKVGYVSGDELLTVKFHADNAEYTLYSISLDKGQAET